MAVRAPVGSKALLKQEKGRQSSEETGDALHGDIDNRPALPLGLPRLYTIDDVCDATGFSDSTIRRAIRLKQLAVIRMGRSIRLTQSDVDAWLDRSRRKAR